MRQPTLFIPHGAGPCFFMEWTRGPADAWDRTAAWLKGLVAGLPEGGALGHEAAINWVLALTWIYNRSLQVKSAAVVG